MSASLSPDQLERRLREVGAELYHDRHPFHRRMRSGRCSRGEIQAWALNRYYYQARIPQKDAAILSRMDDPAARRAWRRRLIDHDGSDGEDGGLEKWLRLTDSLGFERAYVTSTAGILPATRFAVDAYVQFVSSRSLLEAVASSLTELFAPGIIAERMAAMLASYDYLTPETLAYFNARPVQAERDVAFALVYVRANARTAEAQALALDALRTKCSILWAMLDALEHAYVAPGRPPPGAWIPAA